jgi:O-antigen/teichoic acid export membrane protein
MQQQLSSSSSSSTFKPTLMLMAGRGIAFALTFFVPVVLARVFSQTEFGTYKQFTLITYTLFSLGQFGLAECLFYFLPANPRSAGRYAFNSMVMLGAMGTLFSVGLLLNSSRVASWMSNDALTGYMPLAALFLMFMLMGTVLEITMISRKDYKAATATYVLSDLLRAAFLVVPALVFQDLRWTLIGGVVFGGMRVLTIFGYLQKKFGAEARFDIRLLRDQLAYALPYFSYVVVVIVQQNYHQYAVSFNFDAATFAIYAVGCLQIPLVDFMATPASNVMMVQMGEDLREGRRGHLLGVWHDTTRKLAFVFFPLVGVLLVNAYLLITLLYTNAYAASVPIFMIWTVSILFSVFQTDAVLRVFAENRSLFIANSARLAFTALAMTWFLTSFHLIGAVLATLIGILIAKAMTLVRIKSLLQATFSQVLPWKNLGSIFVVAMVSAIPALIVNAKFDVPALVLLPISGMVYMVTYTMLVLVFDLLNESEKAAMKRYLYVWNRRSAESR